MKLRLDKYLADLSVDTRSGVKSIIKKGRVRVNGDIIKQPEFKTDPENDEVFLDGHLLCYEQVEYYMLNKPQGVLSAARDKKQKTVLDLIPTARKDLFPVGRLDKDTVGLLLITNDGELSHRLLSPAHHVDKTYEVHLDGPVTDADIKSLAEGVDIGDEKPTLPAVIDHVDASSTRMCITIREGRFHQIKRMFAAKGREVVFLKRLSMGSLRLDETLVEGTCRKLTAQELNDLKQSAGLK